MNEDFRQAMFINLRAQLEALICKREAMLVANRVSERNGMGVLYREKDFNELAESFTAILPDPHVFE